MRYALDLNPDKQHWSIGRVSALIANDDEILSKSGRWGDNIDPASTLTYYGGRGDRE